MNEQVRVRLMMDDEIKDVRDLVSRVFHDFVAPLFSQEGITQFESFIEPSNLEGQLRKDGFVLVAEVEDELAGVIAMRNWDHIFLLFVEGRLQGRGIARRLVQAALKHCAEQGQSPERVTVNSSPNAVGAYRRMGFIQVSDEEIRNGIRAVPMAMDVSKTDVRW